MFQWKLKHCDILYKYQPAISIPGLCVFSLIAVMWSELSDDVATAHAKMWRSVTYGGGTESFGIILLVHIVALYLNGPL